MLNLILFGPPGSGKGTQSDRLAQRYNIIHISTGDILRDEKKNKTELGLEAKKYIDKGLLVPDEVVTGMLAKKVDTSMEIGAHGFIFDGFPRTIAQAEALDRIMKERETSINGVLFLEVSEDELIKRLTGRGKISGRADDQDTETIRKRIHIYQKETAPVADYYQKQGKLIRVEGEGTIEAIFQSLTREVDAL